MMMIVKPPAGSLVLKSEAPCVVIERPVWVPYVDVIVAIYNVDKIEATARSPPVYTTDNTSAVGGSL